MISRRCSLTGKQFEISHAEMELYKYFDLPLPSILITERLRNLLSFDNQARFFWVSCALSNEQVISYYSSIALFPIVGVDYDARAVDPEKFSQEYSFKKPFFNQLFTLWKAVPRDAFPTLNKTKELSLAVGYDLVDCHFVWNSSKSNNVLYSTDVHDAQNCLDCLLISNSSNCYECIDCHNCINVSWGLNCRECRDSKFLKNCHNCKNCLFCVGLADKEFYIFNQPVSEESYQETVLNWKLSLRSNEDLAKEKFAEFEASFNRNSFDLANYFLVSEANDCLEGCASIGPIKNSARFVGILPPADKVINSIYCGPNVSNLTYCSNCRDSSDLFACVGLCGKQYCILNKQYSKESYLKMVNLVKEQMILGKEWGQFLPATFSPFPYNCSTAGDYLPLSEVQADMLGFVWDNSYENLQPSMVLKNIEKQTGTYLAEIPNSIQEIILSKLAETLFVCEISGKIFGMLPEEIKLYRELGVPPPSRSFEQRYKERILRLKHG